MRKLQLRIGVFASVIAISFAYNVHADFEPAPTVLRVDLMEHTDCVWKGGYLVPISLEEGSQNNDYQLVSIQSKIPLFSWELQSTKNNVIQTGYQIRVASELKLLTANTPDMWDSGKVENYELPYTLYGGKDLKQGNIYYWQVRTWNNGEESLWSTPKPYIMSKNLNKDYEVARYPIQKENELKKKSIYYSKQWSKILRNKGSTQLVCTKLVLKQNLKIFVNLLKIDLLLSKKIMVRN